VIPTLDFETKKIEDRPAYPPEPVGLAVRHPSGHCEYISWGHPGDNTGSYEEAKHVLARYWHGPMLFHNGAFDVAVAVKHFGLPWPTELTNIHDTMFLLYLYDPHAASLALKPSAERILAVPPDEQKDLEDYIRRYINNTKEWGAYISEAPEHVVKPYAIGDVVRTFELYQHLMYIIEREGMLDAYQREQRLVPILEEASNRGIRLDPSIESDLEVYNQTLEHCDNWLRNKLGDDSVNIDSGAELADALDRAGLASNWQLTPTGRRSVSRAALQAAVTCPDTLRVLGYRGALATCLKTFLRPWAHMYSVDGRAHPSWNQVRGDKYGTRTGRLSSSGPNFQNVPNEFNLEVPEGCPPLPLMRHYLLPEEGHVWLKRDFSSQEVRVLAHFEDGSLMRAYQADRRLDPHAYAQQLIREKTGHVLDRKATKIIAFSLLYGAGVNHISDMLGVEYHVAATFRAAYLDSFPNVKQLMHYIKQRGRNGQPVRSWGSRLIYAEKAGHKDLSYKLLNHLIQGSSADITKQAVINYHKEASDSLFTMTVHDEICASCPPESVAREMEAMKVAMDELPLDAPLASDGFVGPSYADVKEYE